MSFDTLLPLIKKSGSTLSPEDFHRNVNIAFHDVEAVHYDAIHADMWKSLSEQIDLLVKDIPESDRSNLKLLDIGCGTGLSTQLLLDTEIGDKISQITLLDTSKEMLTRAAERSKKWNAEVITFNNEVSALEGKFDVIIVCSVLHHIPDLKSFLNKINSLQDPGAIFIHLQDPNGDFMHDAQYLSNVDEFESKTHRSEKKKSALQPIKDLINRFAGRKTYIDLVNDALLGKKAISRRMTAEEIWSVTDIHVENLPYSIGAGISLKLLESELSNYKLLKARSYGFFGPLKSELPLEYQAREQKMIDAGEMNGRHVSAVWAKSGLK